MKISELKRLISNMEDDGEVVICVGIDEESQETYKCELDCKTPTKLYLLRTEKILNKNINLWYRRII